MPEPTVSRLAGDTLPDVASPTATLLFENTTELVEAAAPTNQLVIATPGSTGDAVLSLEDNPLVVAETEEEAGAGLVLDEPAPVALSPLTRMVSLKSHFKSNRSGCLNFNHDSIFRNCTALFRDHVQCLPI